MKILLFFFVLLFTRFDMCLAQNYQFEFSKGNVNPDFLKISPSGKYLIRGKKNAGFKITDNDNPDFVRYLAHSEMPKDIFFSPDENTILINSSENPESILNRNLPVIYQIEQDSKKTFPISCRIFPTPYSDSILVQSNSTTLEIVSVETFSTGSKHQLQQEIKQLSVSGNGEKWALYFGQSIAYGLFFDLIQLKSLTVDSKINALSYSYTGNFLGAGSSNKLIMINTLTNEAYQQPITSTSLVKIQQFDDGITNVISALPNSMYQSKMISWTENKTDTIYLTNTSIHSFTKNRLLQVFFDENGSAFWSKDETHETKYPLFFPSGIQTFNVARKVLSVSNESFNLTFNALKKSVSTVKLEKNSSVIESINKKSDVILFTSPTSENQIYSQIIPFETNIAMSKTALGVIHKRSYWAQSDTLFFKLFPEQNAVVYVGLYPDSTTNQFYSSPFTLDFEPIAIFAGSSGNSICVLAQDKRQVLYYELNSQFSKTFQKDFSQLVDIQFCFNDSLLFFDLKDDKSFFLNPHLGTTTTLNARFNEFQSISAISDNQEVILNGFGEIILFTQSKEFGITQSKPIATRNDIISIKNYNSFFFIHRVNGQIDIVSKSDFKTILGTLVTLIDSYVFVNPNGEYEGNKELLDSFYVTDGKGKRVKKVIYSFRAGLIAELLK